MVIVGCDPGMNGALCAFWRADDDGPEFVADAIDIPTCADNSKTQVDVPALGRWLRRVGAKHFFIENVTPMPSREDENGNRRSMGATSAFRFGMAIGQLRATAQTLGIPGTLVTPRVWKAYYELSGPDKEQSRQLALELYPAAGIYLKRKKDHQRAEAILIARWGDRRVMRRTNI